MCREALSHSSLPSRGQASCSVLYGRVTHANSTTGLGKLLGTILESIDLYSFVFSQGAREARERGAEERLRARDTNVKQYLLQARFTNV